GKPDCELLTVNWELLVFRRHLERQIALPVLRLLGQRRRAWHLRGREVKHLGQVIHPGVALREVRQTVTYFDELQYRRQVPWDVRDVVRLHPWRYGDKRHTETGPGKVSLLVGGQELGRNVVWRWDGEQRHVVIETAAFVIAQEEDRV